MREWLKEIRVNAEKSQYQQAAEIGISQSFYAALESGARGKRISGPMAKKVAATMGFDWQRFYDKDYSVG